MTYAYGRRMAKNVVIPPKAAADIEDRVERVIRGLGNPEPPLKLEDVRELLRLDRRFYTAGDTSAVDEVVSKIRVASKQVLKRPMLLWDAIKKLELKALYLPDSKRILLDGDLPILKHRWNEAHEVGHSLLPWHESVMHGDDQQTLSRACHDIVESEANYAAGRLLFLQERFVEEARSIAPTLRAIRSLGNKFGNTGATTLYRYVESCGDDAVAVGLITCHPHVLMRPSDFNALDPCRYVIQSRQFDYKFGHITEIEFFSYLKRYCRPRRGGPLGSDEIILKDRNGTPFRFYFETFYNTHEAHTLGILLGPVNVMVRASGV